MTAPADGERRALAGYIPQYLVAAHLIYDHIKRGTLDWIRLVDPEAGRVDDLIVGSAGRVDAYQVKWARLQQSYTFQRLLKTEDSSPSLWRRLADGWVSLRGTYPDQVSFVHLVSNEIASANSPLPPEDASEATFQELWADVLARFSRRENIADKYDAALTVLRRESGLPDNLFREFLSRCWLDLAFPDPRHIDQTNLILAAELGDVQALAAYLKNRVSRASGVVHLTRTELLNELGWSARLASHFRHDFVLDVATYKPIEPTTTEIRSMVSRRAFGYVALLGGPGSGKSTTLTHTLRYGERVRPVTYYAYLREDAAPGRGEAFHFWHDLYVAIQALGIRLYEPIPQTAEDFRTAVAKQFQKLSEDFAKSGVITVILVDGLDHIDREQNPTESLIAQLPLPEHVPEGIIIFLGSQTLALNGLAPSIRAHLTGDRTLTMGRLSRADVARLTASMLPPSAPARPADHNLVFERGEGHPLATMYLLGELSRATTPEEVAAALDASRSYGGDIEQRYETYWQGLKNEKARELLGLLCRLRIPANILDALAWTPGIDSVHFLRATRHYFLELSPDRWTFFHNSFRQYLLARTSRNLLDHVDPTRNQAFHARLAAICSNTSDMTLRHEALFHYFNAGTYSQTIAIGTQKHFRDQYCSLRPPHKIYDDLAVVVSAAAETGDGMAFVRSWLVEHELRERDRALSQASFRANLDVFLDDLSLFDAICDGHRLFVPPKDALKAASRLRQAGRNAEARIVFDLAEPLDVLAGISPVDLRAETSRELLNNWVDIALEFRRPSALVEAISRIVTSSINDGDSMPATERLRLDLLTRLGALCASRSSDCVSEFWGSPLLPKDDLSENIDWRLAAEAPTSELRSAAIRRLASLETASWLDGDRVYLADLMRREGFPSQSLVLAIDGISQPALQEDERDRFTSAFRIEDFSHRICLCRLLAFVGKPVQPEAAISWPTGSDRQRAARYERMLVTIANVWGDGLRGNTLTPAAIDLALKYVLRTFDKVGTEDAGSSWYRYEATRSDFFKLVVRAVASHGQEAVDHLGKAFDQIWRDGNSRSHWPSGLRRSIALALIGVGADASASKDRIDALDNSIEGEDLDERIEASIEQARAWRLLGERQRAADLLTRTLTMSFGVYHHKDRQFQSWVEWLDRAVRSGATTVGAELDAFASATKTFERTGRGRGTQDAAAHLISIAIREDVGLGMGLADALLRDHVVGYSFLASGVVLGLQSRLDCDYRSMLPYLSLLGVALELPSPGKIAENLGKGFGTASQLSDADLEPLIDGVLVHEFANSRWAWLSSLDDGLRASGVSNKRVSRLAERSARRRDSTPQEVKLLDGTSITDHQLEDEIRDYQSLASAIDRVQPDALFSWGRIAEPIIKTLALDDLQVLLGKFGRLRETHTAVVAAFAERFVQLGAPERAEELVLEELKGSRAWGWIRWYDGGSRLRPAQVLVGINEQKYRVRMIKQIAQDYLTEVRNPSDFVMSIEDLAPILFHTIPWELLWNEVKEHICQLAEFRSERPHIAPIDVEGPKHALLLSVLSLFRLPIPELEYRCASVLAAWLSDSEGHGWPLEYISQALQAQTLPSWKVAYVLSQTRSLANCDCTSLDQLLMTATDFSARSLARAIFSATSSTDRLRRPRDRQDAPIALRMALSPMESDEPSVPVAVAAPRGKPRARPQTTLDLFHIWLPELRVLSKASGIRLENLMERARQLADVHHHNSEWGEDADGNLHKHLRGIELQLRYRRPWSEFGMLAIQELISELVDHGYIKPDVILGLHLDRVFDPTLSKVLAQSRPAQWVSAMSESPVGSRSNWIDGVNGQHKDLAVHSASKDGLFVVAEYSRFRRFDWDLPTETRVTLLERQLPATSSKEDLARGDTEWFPVSRYSAADEYPGTGDGSFVSGGNAFRLRMGLKRWLAIAPDIARAMGARSLCDPPFAWGIGDTTLVWSLYWRDGPGERQPPKLYDVFGEGWLVLARKDALLKANLGPLQVRYTCVRETTGNHGDSDDERVSTGTLPVLR